MVDRCHWVHTQDGRTTLIPGCWSRVHDPEAECLCGKWSEAEAARIISGLEGCLYHERHTNHALRMALKKAGITDPTDMTLSLNLKQYTVRQRIRALHRAISATVEDE